MRLLKVLAQNEYNMILAFSIGKNKSYVQIQNQVSLKYTMPTLAVHCSYVKNNMHTKTSKNSELITCPITDSNI